MADEHSHSTTIHSDPATLDPSNSSPAADDPPPPPATVDDGPVPKNPEDPEPGTGRESKRRKLCPTALEKKCEAIVINSSPNSSNCFSFSFDPKFSFGVSTPEVTPKFGSFNLVPEDTEIEVNSAEEGGGKKEEDGVNGKRKLIGILGSDDGDDDDAIGISAEDYLADGPDLYL